MNETAKSGTSPLPPAARRVLRAVAEAVVPEAVSLPEREWREFECIVGDAVSARPREVRRQIVLFLRLLDVLALARRGRRLHALPQDVRSRFLERLQDAPVMLVRRGFWGIRTLALMGYYARAEAAREIGYRAHPRGWEARGSEGRA